jgi:hypothetical protein
MYIPYTESSATTAIMAYTAILYLNFCRKFTQCYPLQLVYTSINHFTLFQIKFNVSLRCFSQKNACMYRKIPQATIFNRVCTCHSLACYVWLQAMVIRDPFTKILKCSKHRFLKIIGNAKICFLLEEKEK